MAPLRVECGSTSPVCSLGEAAVAVLVERSGVLARASGGVGGGSVLEGFAAISAPRCRRGIRHSLPTILGLCLAAVLTGQVSLTDITDWVSAADQELLAALGAWQGPDGRYAPPHPDTIERVLGALGAQGVADQVGGYLGRKAGIKPVTFPISGPVLQPAIAVDGKAVRGAIGPDRLIPYLLAAATHGESVVIAERLVGAKTNEVPEFQPLLRDLPVGVGGRVFTMDAGHTVRAHDDFIAGELPAHYVMTVKENTRYLFDQLNALGWGSVPISDTTIDTGHGRHERRTIQVMDAPADLGFPHCAQVFLIERYTTRTVRRRAKHSPSTRQSGSRPPSRSSGSPASAPARPHQPTWPPMYADTGRSKTRSIGSVCHVP